MKVAIVGSRDFAQRPWTDLNEHTKNMDSMIDLLVMEMDNEDYVVSGGALGADSLGESFAKAHNVGRIIHAAHWEKHGKAAGPIRNALIVRDADILFAFYTDINNSRGTANCVAQAKKKGIIVAEYDAKEDMWFIAWGDGRSNLGPIINYGKILSQVNQPIAREDKGDNSMAGMSYRDFW